MVQAPEGGISGDPAGGNSPAMTPQQRRLAGGLRSRLATYKELHAADRGWRSLFCLECSNLLFSARNGFFGQKLRSAVLPLFCKQFGAGSVCGCNVTIRQPSRIAIGNNVVLEDRVVLDVRTGENSRAPRGIDISDGSYIGSNTIISTKGGNIRLAEDCEVGPYCRIATRSRVDIGRGALIGPYTYIGCGNHRFDDPSKPIMEQEMDVRDGVSIGAGVQIGANVTVLDGVSIGRGAVVEPYSLVRSDIPEDAVASGMPAKVVSPSPDQGIAR